MKNLHILVAICFAAILCIPIVPEAQALEAEVKRANFTVNFYNVTDFPPAVPYMRIIFSGMPEKEEAKVSQWRKEIDEKLQELGGVETDEDYSKLSKVIPEYAARFIETGSFAIAIEFPRKKQGILLYKKK